MDIGIYSIEYPSLATSIDISNHRNHQRKSIWLKGYGTIRYRPSRNPRRLQTFRPFKEPRIFKGPTLWNADVPSLLCHPHTQNLTFLSPPIAARSFQHWTDNSIHNINIKGKSWTRGYILRMDLNRLRRGETWKQKSSCCEPRLFIVSPTSSRSTHSNRGPSFNPDQPRSTSPLATGQTVS